MVTEINNSTPVAANSAINKINSHNTNDVQRVSQSSVGNVDNKDKVSLTPAAERIRQTDGNKQATIDTKRVEAIREQINNGNYRVNASRVADKLFSFESALSGASRKR